MKLLCSFRPPWTRAAGFLRRPVPQANLLNETAVVWVGGLIGDPQGQKPSKSRETRLVDTWRPDRSAAHRGAHTQGKRSAHAAEKRCTRRPGKLHMQSVFVDSYTKIGRKEQRTRRGKGGAHAHAQGPHTQSGRSEQPRCIRSFRRRSRTQGRRRRNQRGRASTSML